MPSLACPWVRRTCWLPLVLGCRGVAQVLRHRPDREQCWDLRLSHHAVALSMTPPYDTLTRPRRRRLNYAMPAGLPAPVYTLNAPPSRGRVGGRRDQGCGVTSVYANGSSQGRAALTVDDIKHSDTVDVVVVNNPAPPVPSGSLDPSTAPGQREARRGRTYLGGSLRMPTPTSIGRLPSPLRVVDTANNPIHDVVAYIETADPRIACFAPVLGVYCDSAVRGIATPTGFPFIDDNYIPTIYVESSGLRQGLRDRHGVWGDESGHSGVPGRLAAGGGGPCGALSNERAGPFLHGGKLEHSHKRNEDRHRRNHNMAQDR